MLRRALNATLARTAADARSALWRRWKWEQLCRHREYGLVYDEAEWASEWQSLLRLSSLEPRVHEASGELSGEEEVRGAACYFESLEEFHVFLLAHILQRPIVIVADTMLHDLNGEPLSPIPVSVCVCVCEGDRDR